MGWPLISGRQTTRRFFSSLSSSNPNSLPFFLLCQSLLLLIIIAAISVLHVHLLVRVLVPYLLLPSLKLALAMTHNDLGSFSMK